MKSLFGYGFVGRCGICDRPIWTPESLARGIGPVCAGKHQEFDEYGYPDRELADYYLDIPVEDGIFLYRDGVEGDLITNVPHLVIHHSPTGYEWGYGGSGPSDLALNLVELTLRKIGYDGPKTDDVWDKSSIFCKSLELEFDFKVGFVAAAPRDGGHIPWEVVVEWVKSRLAVSS